MVKGLRPTYHDLHALSMFNDEAVVVGGVDGFIYIHDCVEFTQTTKHRNKVMLDPGTPIGSPIMQVAPGNNIVLVHGGNNLLSTVFVPPPDREATLGQLSYLSTGEFIQFYESPKLLHQIMRMSRGGWGITASSISHSGRFICYSCLDSLYLIKLPDIYNKETNVQPQTIDLYREYKMVPGYHIAFGMNDHLLVVISRNHVLQVLNLITMTVVFNMPLRDQSITTTVGLHDNDKRSSCFSNEAVHSMHLNPNNGLIAIAQGESVLVFDLAPVVNDSTKQHPSYTKPKWSFTVKSNTNLSDTGLEAIIYRVKFFNAHQFYVLLTGNVVMLADVAQQDHSFFGDMRTGLPRSDSFHRPFHTVIPLLQRRTTPAGSFSTLYLCNNESLFTYNGRQVFKEKKVC